MFSTVVHMNVATTSFSVAFVPLLVVAFDQIFLNSPPIGPTIRNCESYSGGAQFEKQTVDDSGLDHSATYGLLPSSQELTVTCPENPCSQRASQRVDSVQFEDRVQLGTKSLQFDTACGCSTGNQHDGTHRRVVRVKDPSTHTDVSMLCAVMAT